MKLSIVVSTQPASFTALAYQGRLRETLGKIQSLGYDGVELAVRDPRLLDSSSLQSMLVETGLPVPAIGTGQAYGEERLSLTHPDDAVRAAAVERIKSHMDLAAELKALVIIGLIRGRKEPGVSTDRAEAWFLEGLWECAGHNRSVRLAIEPINRYETDLLNTVGEALALLDRLQEETVGLLLDTFHMNIEEPSIAGSMESARDRLFHFHVADSNRWYPGAGHIDFAGVLRTLERLNYQGFVSAEILPCPDPDKAASQTIGHLRALASVGPR